MWHRAQKASRLFSSSNPPISGIAAAVGVCTLISSSLSHVPVLVPSQDVNCAQMARCTLSRMGITPIALAACGATDEQIGLIVGATLAICESQAGQFHERQRRLESIRRDMQVLEATVRVGAATSTQRSALVDARYELSAIDSAQSQWETLVESAIGAVLSEPQNESLGYILSAKNVEIPVQYKFASRTEADWVALRDSISRSRGGLSQEPSPDPAIDLIANLVDQRRAAASAAWNNALNQ